jgi:hypothetical protein
LPPAPCASVTTSSISLGRRRRMAVIRSITRVYPARGLGDVALDGASNAARADLRESFCVLRRDQEARDLSG